MEPEEIEAKEFLVSLRGYDREEVAAFLREIAAELRQLRLQIGNAPPSEASTQAIDAYRRIGEETSRILVAAEETANNIREKARSEMEGMVAAARKESKDMLAAARTESEQSLAAARKESIETLASARKESEETVGAARQEAAELLGSARQEAISVEKSIAEALEAAEEDLQALRQARTVLATQLEDVRRRLDETIARLQAPVETLPPRKTSKLPSISPTVTERPEAPVRSRGAEAEVIETPPPAVEFPAPPVEEEAAPMPAEGPAPEAAVVEFPVASDAAAVTEPEARPAEPESLEALLDEIRLEREQARHDVEDALAQAAAITGQSEETVQATGAEVLPSEESPALAARNEALGEGPLNAARRLKRVLQEDQNDLLDRIRTRRGRGSFDADISPEAAQVQRFEQGLFELLGSAFEAGRNVAGATDATKADEIVRSLVTKQIVVPLRKELARVVESGIEAQDTPTAIAERSSDIYRVWKGVRTELLGEGLVYSAYHQGLMDVWRKQGAALKKWVLATDEDQCPRELCETNSGAGPIAVDSPFPSGHTAPPAHGGCTCTLTGPDGV